MTTDPDLADRAFRAGATGADKPDARGELEQRVVDNFYRAGQRSTAGEPPEPGSVEEWRRMEGRVVDECRRALYSTPELEVPHEPGG